MGNESEPINAGPLARMLTLLTYRIRGHKYLQRLWKPSPGLLSVSNFCIKVKPFENLGEAHAMRFVAQHTSIPVPKVYCAFVHKGATYIVMRKIDGQIARRGWVERAEESKKRILAQLRSMVDELRAISPPEGIRVANVNGGPVYDLRLPAKRYLGPFDTVREFHKELVDGFDIERYSETTPPHPLEDPELTKDLDELFAFYRQSGEEVVFTHGDLSSLNILVRGDDVVGIIDWETSGWLPPYWEYSCAWNVNPHNPFWQEEVDKFITPMPYELKMDGIRRKYFGDLGW